MGETIAGYVFYEIAALLVLAATAGFVGVMLRQPLIVSFIAVGVVAGPSVLDIARSDEHIDLLAELGIALLLFLVGLKLDLKLVRALGPVALTTGLGQVAFTTVFGLLIGLALDLDLTTAIYVAVALTFSSTIIIVKLLSDKREIDSLHGRIALGFLIVQDIVVVIAMIALSGLGLGAESGGGATAIWRVAAYGAGMLAAVAIFIRTMATPLVERLARAPELLVSFSIGWAALLAALGHYLGFGKELGGLLAGVSLASTPYREAIAARLASLRDFLLLFFFIALGSALDLSVLGASVGPALVFSVFVLVGNPLIVLIIMSAMGYDHRTGFLAGLTVAQISEFSLIFMAMCVSNAHDAEDALGLLTLVVQITIAASTYKITYSHHLYELAEPALKRLPGRRRADAEDDQDARAGATDVLVFGVGRYGLAVAQSLTARGLAVLAVDFNPVVVKHAHTHGLHALYGDASDPEFLAHLPLATARWVVSAMPEHDPGLSGDDPRRVLVRTLKGLDYRGRVAIAAHGEVSSGAIAELGADLVLSPYRDAAVKAADLIADGAGAPTLDLTDPQGQRDLD